jgi:hypothetical protein
VIGGLVNNELKSTVNPRYNGPTRGTVRYCLCSL